VTPLIGELTLREKVMMLSGEEPFWTGMRALLRQDSVHTRPFRAARNERAGIPGLAFVDGPRGVVLEGGATTFPVSMARGATWNPQLEEQIGDAIGKELRALGGNLFGGVCVNLLRHPAWGRAQETYGEDPLHLGAMGAALVRGVQRHAMACVKHFALNSMENARFKVDVRVGPRALHEVYLPQFKDCVDAGAVAVMSAYNAVNGEWCGQSKTLLTDILKQRWGFKGYVLTDFIFGLRDARTAIENGLDLEMPFQMVWAHDLLALVERGEVDEALVDRALERLIPPQLELPPAADYPSSLIGHADHKALAREAATQSIVLLKNERTVLPLSKDHKIVVLGSLAATPNLGDHGSSDGRPEYVITPLAGLQAALGDKVTYLDSPHGASNQDQLRGADAVVVVVGYTSEEEGEFVAPDAFAAFAPLLPPPAPVRWLFGNSVLRPAWRRIAGALMKLGAKRAVGEQDGDGAAFGLGGDRVQLGLPEKDRALIEAACAANRNVIVAMMGGSAITMEEWRDRPAAILMLWYPGMEGGHAFADVLLGERNPGGKLPFSIPRSADDLPFFDRDAARIDYDYWHGYRKLDQDGVEPAYPFGFGLSYSEFSYANLECSSKSLQPDEKLTVSLEVTNAGDHAGDEVVQIYTSARGSAVERPNKELKAFQRVAVDAGETRRVEIELPIHKLAYFDEASDDFVVEPIEYEVMAARHASDPDALRTTIRVVG